jgi:hypothetical protein
MSTKTGGTNATSTLTALQWTGQYGATSISDADIATIANDIIQDNDPPAILPGAFSRMGLLYIPRRGILKMRDGDWVMVGPEGFPYLVPRIASPGTLTATTTGGTSATPGTITFAASVLTRGWMVGAAISGTNVASGALILAISGDGLTVTANTTGTPSGTITVGSWTHS